jgi:hypothetical protein
MWSVHGHSCSNQARRTKARKTVRQARAPIKRTAIRRKSFGTLEREGVGVKKRVLSAASTESPGRSRTPCFRHHEKILSEHRLDCGNRRSCVRWCESCLSLRTEPAGGSRGRPPVPTYFVHLRDGDGGVTRISSYWRHGNGRMF